MIDFQYLHDILYPPTDLGCQKWCDTHRIIPPDSSPEPGPWRTSRVPYLAEPMAAITDPLIRTIVLEFSTQSGKTELILNAQAYFIAIDPGPMIQAMPTAPLCTRYIKERFEPMVRATPRLKELMPAIVKKKDEDNKMFRKGFPTGVFTDGVGS